MVAVDQFEEVFTAAATRPSGRRSSTRWSRRARDPRRRALVLVAMRADFYGRCAAYPSCRACWAPTTCWSGRCAATSCAARSSCRPAAPAYASSRTWSTRWSPTSRASPAALPLLSTSLLELWQRRDGRRLRMSAYEQTGGVQGAVARLAESAY